MHGGTGCNGVLKISFVQRINMHKCIYLSITLLWSFDNIMVLNFAGFDSLSFFSDDVAYSGVQAVDDDNDVLTYTITSDYFIINPSTAVVTVARSLIDAPGKQAILL